VKPGTEKNEISAAEKATNFDVTDSCSTKENKTFYGSMVFSAGRVPKARGLRWGKASNLKDHVSQKRKGEGEFIGFMGKEDHHRSRSKEKKVQPPGPRHEKEKQLIVFFKFGSDRARHQRKKGSKCRSARPREKGGKNRIRDSSGGGGGKESIADSEKGKGEKKSNSLRVK